VRRLDRLTLDEFANMSSRTSGVLGMFGGDPAANPVATRQAARRGWSSFSLIADAMSVPFDDVVMTGEIAVARHDVEVAEGTIKAGTVAAMRMETTGIRKGEGFMRLRQTFYVTSDLEPAWELPEGVAGWRMQIEGDTPLDIRIDFPVAPEHWGATSPGLTAHRPVNVVPYVCEAEPGIKTTVDLPQVIATFG